MTAPAPNPTTLPVTASDRPSRAGVPAGILVTAVLFGLACGAFEITNTSIGWHIASGRWMLEQREILDRDPFSFTSGGADWIDHEWLFQIIVAGLFDAGGAPLLVALRMLLVALLTVLLLRIAISSGLDPPFALVLAALCVLGARPRFFLRPELFTLVLLPLSLWLFSDRRGRRWWPLPVVLVIALGANLHGAILVAPILISAWFAGEVLDQLTRRQADPGSLRSGAAGVVAAFAAPLLNPHGAAIWSVPFTLADMVRMPHIPNPEWISPTPATAPWFFLAAAFAAAVLAVGSRSPRDWFTAAAAVVLALRHIRNIGLFFVLLPQTVAPAMARWPLLARGGVPDAPLRRRRSALCLALVVVLALAAALRPWPRAGLDFADRWYPDRAWRFLETHELSGRPLYNDVRFGGWLAMHAYPDQRIFLDDRNEIHEPLLREMWEILTASDVDAWEALLGRWNIDTVLLRYHEPIQVATPDGHDLGRRGFSTLWFSPDRWALLYWDDAAMVLVRRDSVSDDLLTRRELRIFRPDDVEHVLDQARRDPSYRSAVAVELQRVLADDPECFRALTLANKLAKQH